MQSQPMYRDVHTQTHTHTQTLRLNESVYIEGQCGTMWHTMVAYDEGTDSGGGRG